MPENRTYSKDRLTEILALFKIYQMSPQERAQSEEFKKLNIREEEVSGLFAQTVEQAEKDIADYAQGALELDNDAYDIMKEYIEMFGKNYQPNRTPRYAYSSEAIKALAKLQKDKQGLGKEKEIKKEKKTKEKATGKSKTQASLSKESEVKRNNKDLQTQALDSRIREPHNLSNEQRLALVRLQVLREKRIISQGEFNRLSSNLQSDNVQRTAAAFSFIEGTEERITDLNDYKRSLSKALLEQKQSDLLTPELCVFAYNNLPSEKADITSQMDALHDDFKNKRGYYLLDITNAADAYDGYAHMFDVRQKSLDEELSQYQQSKQSTSAQSEEAGNKVDSIKKLKEDYRKSEQDLNEIIANYDQYWNISDLQKGWSTSVRLNDRVKTLSNILGNIKFNEATLGQEVLAEISNFKFHDQEGKPIAQFRDAKNPSITSDSWREGFEVIPDSQLATVLKLSGNDILMSELGSKEEIDAQKITQALKENIPFKLFEMYNSEEIIRQAIEDPKKFTENKEQYLTQFRERLNNPQAPLVISAEGYNAALDAQVNKVEVFANRLDNKLGRDNNEFVRSNLFEQVQKIDKQAPLRGRNKEEIRKGSLKRALWGIGIGGGVAYLGSRLVTNAAASGGVSLIGSSALALGTAVTVGAATTALQIWSRKKAAKRRGEKYGWKEFKKDKMLHISIATTTLACASAAFAMANAPELAIPCAVASFGMGAGLRFAQPYRDLRLKGHNKATALALGAVNAAAVFVGGYFGRQDGLNDITPNTQEVVTGYRDVKVGEVKSYNQDLISKVTERNHTDSMWEYRGEGPHTIEAYRTPENYSNEAWWTPEQHDKAIAALKEQMPKLGWKEGVGNEEVMLRKLASFE